MLRGVKASALSLIFLAFFGASAVRGQDDVLFSEDFTKPLGDRWKQIRFHDPTEYFIVTDGSNACVHAFAQGGCSALATRVNLECPRAVTLSWRWKIDRCPPNGADDRLSAFDHSAKVFVAFDSWIGPPRTINYVWANRAPTNSVFEHPLSSRTRFISVECGNANAGRWLMEKRDVRKDWALLFKGDPMPKIVGIGIFTDSHYTQVPLNAWYGNIVLSESAGSPAATATAATKIQKSSN